MENNKEKGETKGSGLNVGYKRRSFRNPINQAKTIPAFRRLRRHFKPRPICESRTHLVQKEKERKIRVVKGLSSKLKLNIE